MDLTVLIALVVVGLATYWFFCIRSPAQPDSPVASRPTSAPAQKRPVGDVTIVFASQTGTAEMYAKTLVREGHQVGVNMRAVDVEGYRPDDLEAEKLVVFVAATYGEGEPTDTMKDFYDAFMAPHNSGLELQRVSFTVFGLGDRQYKHFCQMGRDLDKRMAELGAKRVHALGEGDCGSAMEETFDEWKAGLWPAVEKALGITLKTNTEEPSVPELKINYIEDAAAPVPFPKAASALEPTQKQPVYVTVSENRELLKVSGRSTRHIELDITDSMISYQAGDHAGLLPCNPDNVVNDYLKILKLSDADAEKVITLIAADGSSKRNALPARATIRTALKWYIDLCGAPKKSSLRAFAHYCTDDREKEDFLSVLRVNPESQERYHKLQAKVRNVFGFLRKYQSCAVPIGHFLELMPRIAPRYFSIGSDQLYSGKKISITVAVLDDGLCTQMLAKSPVGTKLPIFVRKSTFHLPLRAKNRPVILIGPGTGVAPLLGFCYRRLAWQKKNHELGENLFFFGCRKKSEDYVYQDFLEECASNKIITQLNVAFSRDQKEKVYVQHQIRDRAADVWRVIDNGGNIYVCGDAKCMARDVEATLVDIIAEFGKKSKEAAAAFLETLVKSERYHKDVWTS